MHHMLKWASVHHMPKWPAFPSNRPHRRKERRKQRLRTKRGREHQRKLLLPHLNALMKMRCRKQGKKAERAKKREERMAAAKKEERKRLEKTSWLQYLQWASALICAGRQIPQEDLQRCLVGQEKGRLQGPPPAGDDNGQAH